MRIAKKQEIKLVLGQIYGHVTMHKPEFQIILLYCVIYKQTIYYVLQYCCLFDYCPIEF